MLELEVCPECKSTNILLNGAKICRNCGLVIEDRIIDYSNENNRHFIEKFEKRNHYGDPIYDSTQDLARSTYIDYKHAEYDNFSRIAKRDKFKYIRSKSQLTIYQKELKQLAKSFNLNKQIINEALRIYKQYKKVNEKGLLGWRNHIFSIVCLLISCKLNNNPISFIDYTKKFNIPERSLFKYYQKIVKLLKLNNQLLITKPELILSRIINNLGLSFDFEKEAIELLNKLPKSLFQGKNIKGICSAIIYFLAKQRNLDLTQQRIAKIAGICEVTIRAILKKIKR